MIIQKEKKFRRHILLSRNGKIRFIRLLQTLVETWQTMAWA